MRAEDKKQRYEDILKKIERRRPFGSAQEEEKPRRPQDRVLDLLNSFDALADIAQRDFERVLCYGPQTFHGPAWSGVVIWYHSKGYHGYQTLASARRLGTLSRRRNHAQHRYSPAAVSRACL